MITLIVITNIIIVIKIITITIIILRTIAMEGMGKMLCNCDGLFSFLQLKPLLSQSLPA